jgi:hypothetical protein
MVKSLGLPPLHASLGEHFSALSQSFGVKCSNAILFPLSRPASINVPPLDLTSCSSPAVDYPLQVPSSDAHPSNSPLSDLVGFFMEHPQFYSFCLISLSTFTSDLKTCPAYTVNTIDDPLFAKGFWSIERASLRRFVDGKWKAVHKFHRNERACLPDLPKDKVYFNLVDSV